MKSQVAAFEASHPGVAVEWVDVPYVALDRKLVAAAAAGRAPDVVNMSDVNFARYASLGAFADLGPLLPGDAEKQYLAGALAICKINGSLQSVPWYVAPEAVIANEALLAAGGLSVRTLGATWPELAAQARAFKDKTGTFLFSQPMGEESQLPIMLLGEGLVPFKEEEGRLVADLTRDDIVAYLDVWVRLYRDGYLPRESATSGHAHLPDLYQNGQLAVISTGPSFLTRIRDAAPKIYATTTVLPGMPGRLGRNHMPVMMLAVSSTSTHPREAAALAWFLTSPDAQTEFSKRSSIMPSTPASFRDPFFRGEADGTMPADALMKRARMLSARSLPTAAAFTAALDTWPDLRKMFEEGIKGVLLDNHDLRQTLEEINWKWNRKLKAAAPATMQSVPRPAKVEPVARD
jgi:putative chitobiose transport system substrate-binding protein